MTQYQPPQGQYQQQPGQYQPPGGYSPYQPQQKKKSNVWKYVGIGCLCLILLCIGGCLAIYFVIKGVANNLVENYTDTEPREMPVVQMTDEEVQFTLDQVKLFVEAVDAGTAVRPLILTADQINAIIQQNPEFENLDEMVYVSIEDNKLKGDISLPLGELIPDMPIVNLEGRYLNGSAVFSINITDGYLIVRIQDVEVKGQKVPEEIMKDVRTENFAQDANNDPEMRPTLEKINSLEIQDNKLIITPKAPNQ